MEMETGLGLGCWIITAIAYDIIISIIHKPNGKLGCTIQYTTLDFIADFQMQY